MITKYGKTAISKDRTIEDGRVKPIIEKRPPQKARFRDPSEKEWNEKEIKDMTLEEKKKALATKNEKEVIDLSSVEADDDWLSTINPFYWIEYLLLFIVLWVVISSMICLQRRCCRRSS